MSKLSAADARTVRLLAESGVPKVEIARQYRVHRSTIFRALAGDTWRFAGRASNSSGCLWQRRFYGDLQPRASR